MTTSLQLVKSKNINKVSLRWLILERSAGKPGPCLVSGNVNFQTYHNSQVRVGHCAQTILGTNSTSNVFSAKHLFLSKSLKFVMLVEGAYMASSQ